MVFHWLKKLWYTAPGDSAAIVLDAAGRAVKGTAQVAEAAGSKAVKGAEVVGKVIKDA